MNTISDYVRKQQEARGGDATDQVLRLRERAIRHQRESERLVRMGDARQAAMHASIARAHVQSARALEASDPVLAL